MIIVTAQAPPAISSALLCLPYLAIAVGFCVFLAISFWKYHKVRRLRFIKKLWDKRLRRGMKIREHVYWNGGRVGIADDALPSTSVNMTTNSECEMIYPNWCRDISLGDSKSHNNRRTKSNAIRTIQQNGSHLLPFAMKQVSGQMTWNILTSLLGQLLLASFRYLDAALISWTPIAILSFNQWNILRHIS